jgi:hypothetical protein
MLGRRRGATKPSATAWDDGGLRCVGRRRWRRRLRCSLDPVAPLGSEEAAMTVNVGGARARDAAAARDSAGRSGVKDDTM